MTTTTDNLLEIIIFCCFFYFAIFDNFNEVNRGQFEALMKGH